MEPKPQAVHLMTTLLVVIAAATVAVDGLRCYHDKYVTPGTNTETKSEIKNDSNMTTNMTLTYNVTSQDPTPSPTTNKVKQCGKMEKCQSCMTITTTVPRHERWGQEFTTREDYRVVSRVCVKEKGAEREEGCHLFGRKNAGGGTTNICYCHRDLCNK